MERSGTDATAPFSVQSSGPIPVGSPVLREYRSPLRPWVWACFWVNAVITTVFSILCAFVYQSFVDTASSLQASSPQAQLGLPLSDWQALFWGAAVSAIFAFVISVLFHAGTLLLLLCSFKSLARPERRYGRAVVTAAAFFSALHILNITLQLSSFSPVMATLRDRNATAFNTSLLKACLGLGYLSSCLYWLFMVLVMCWKERPDLVQVHVPGACPAP